MNKNEDNNITNLLDKANFFELLAIFIILTITAPAFLMNELCALWMKGSFYLVNGILNNHSN
jgi:hypothetical protein